jgi:hypothetical protein
MPEYVQYDGLEELLNALAESPEVAVDIFSRVLDKATLAIEGRVRPYPPATYANQPRSWTSGGDNRWYERGYGPKWVRKDGSINGRKTSRFLGRQWTREISIYPNGVSQMGIRGPVAEAIMGNSAPYVNYVQGRKQARFHAERGWVTLDDAVTQSDEDIQAAINDGADELMMDLGN